MAWVATAIVGSALVGGAVSVYGSSKAADAQTQAAAQAAQTQMAMYNQTRSDLQPYRKIGEDAYAMLQPKLQDLTTPISINPNDLENSDYYRFASKQGQKAVTNSSAARGLSNSGAALKGAATFAEGLATGTYKDAFNMAVTNQTNAYTRLKGLIDTGQSAAAQTGSAGSNAATGVANAQIGAGNAQAAGINAGAAGINSALGNIGGYAAYKGIYGGNGSPGNGSGSSITVGGNFGNDSYY